MSPMCRADMEPMYLPVAAPPPPGLPNPELAMLRSLGAESAPERLGPAVASLEAGPQPLDPAGRTRKSGSKAAKGPKCRAPEDVYGKGSQYGDTRWWTKLQDQLLCPLSRFPIRLLPYPPFKLRTDCSKPGPHCLVDGKFLAMKLIVDGRPGAGIRELEASDILALDDYIQRCKLGPFRPGTARALQQEMQNGKSQSDRVRAAEELHKLQQKTSTELDRLRRIQDNRLTQLKTELKAPPKLALAGTRDSGQAPRPNGKLEEFASLGMRPALATDSHKDAPDVFFGIVGELEKRGAAFAGRLQL